jgi:hypothetical protein
MMRASAGIAEDRQQPSRPPELSPLDRSDGLVIEVEPGKEEPVCTQVNRGKGRAVSIGEAPKLSRETAGLRAEEGGANRSQ